MEFLHVALNMEGGVGLRLEHGVSSINTMNTSLSFLCISSVHIVNLSKTFHFSFSFLLNYKNLFLEIEIQVKVLEKFP